MRRWRGRSGQGRPHSVDRLEVSRADSERRRSAAPRPCTISTPAKSSQSRPGAKRTAICWLAGLSRTRSGRRSPLRSRFPPPRSDARCVARGARSSTSRPSHRPDVAERYPLHVALRARTLARASDCTPARLWANEVSPTLRRGERTDHRGISKRARNGFRPTNRGGAAIAAPAHRIVLHAALDPRNLAGHRRVVD
jgi:hypothetical protein